MTYLKSGPSLLDKIMGRITVIMNTSHDALPDDEIGCFYRWQLLQNENLVEPSLGELIKFSLTAKNEDHALKRMQQKARKELQPFMQQNLLHKLTGSVKDVNIATNLCSLLLEHRMAANNS